MKKVGVIMGSDSDLPVVEKAIDKLKEYGVPYEVHVYSAHRTQSKQGSLPGQPRRTDLGRSSRPRGRRRIWQGRWRPTPRCR